MIRFWIFFISSICASVSFCMCRIFIRERRVLLPLRVA